MDIQGTPIGSTNQGMKHTTDPASKIPIREGAGPVASDSLAAESTRAGGVFGENRDSNPLSVEGSKSTLNNTDTSSATTLPPAADSAGREPRSEAQALSDDAKGPAGAKYAEAIGGQGKFSGVHNADGYYGGPSDGNVAARSTGGAAARSTDNSASNNNSPSDQKITSENDTSSSSVDPAPTYIASQYVNPGLPKGKNLKEGGFDSDDKNNASFNSDIGTENDPGRAAEVNFQKTATSNVGSGPRQGGLSGDGQYDALETDQNL